MKKHILSITCLSICLPLLMGCGIKPKNVNTPSHVEHDTYPTTYPAPESIPSS